MSAKSTGLALLVVFAVVAIPLFLKPAPDVASARPEAVQPCAPADGSRDSCASASASGSASAATEALLAAPRFVDLGTTTCVPCRVMLGVMAELEARYPYTLRVEFINIHDQPDAMGKYRFRAIPSQLFFDPDGKELFRHTGVMRADAVVAKWSALGYDLKVPSAGTK